MFIIKNLFLVILVITNSYGFQILEKVIDKLYYENSTPKNIYWIDVVQGKCNINTEFSDVDSSILVNYQFASSSKSDFFEILMNYDKNTKSFQCDAPVGISLKLRLDNGQSNNDVLKFMLIEDLSMDGAFNGDDAMFAFEYQMNSLNSNWLEVMMPYDKFSLWYSNSQNTSKKINLNKIRAWRITIFNENENIKRSNKIFLKDLKTSCRPQPSNNLVNKYIKSTFIQLWNDAGCVCGEWNFGRWIIEIGRMIDVGIERLVIQYSVYGAHSWYSNNPDGMSTLDRIVVAAEYHNFKIVFGLYFDESWNWASKYDESVYNELYLKHRIVIDDIFKRYGAKSVFEGFYLPQEWNNVEWKNDNSIALLAYWTRNVLNYAKSKKDNLKLVISPFFRSTINRETTALLFDKYLSIVTNNNNGPYIDEIYIQDSHGVAEQNSLFDIYNYLEAIKSYTNKYGSSLGVTIEIFNQTNTNGAFAAVPANIDRVKSQIKVANYLTNNLIQFEWSYMMQNKYNLFYDYKNYYYYD